MKTKGPRGNDSQVAIDLHGIGIDDAAAKRFGEPERQRRLAAGSRPGDQDGGGLGQRYFLLK